MSDDDAPPVAPYTGRPSAGQPEPAPAAPVPSPRIRWGRIIALQLGAGFLVGLAVPIVAGRGDPQWIVIGLASGLLIGAVGGGVPLLGAGFAYIVATRWGRGAMRETGAVMLGAILGSLLLSLALFGITGGQAPFVFLIVLVIGLPSAIGFAIWMLVAWGPHLQSRPVR